MTKITSVSLATLMMASSCTSSYQAAGGVTGAMIGSHVGNVVGFLSGSGHFRGENAALGSLIGMGVGALLGVGIANQIEQKEAERARQYGQANNYDYQEGAYNNDNRTEMPDYQIGGGAYQGTSHATVSISDLTYMDADGDGCISKGETIEVEGFITNTSNAEMKDIVISLSVDNQKNYRISPSLTTTLQPGQKIRYTGRVHCDKVKRGQALGIYLCTNYMEQKNTSNVLFVRTR